MVVEIIDRDHILVHEDVAATVDALLGAMHASLIAPTLFWCNGIAAQQRVNGCRNIFMHQDVIAVDDLHHHVKRDRR